MTKKKYKTAYYYGNDMYVGLKQPTKKTNPDGTKQGYYYGNGFYGPDEGDKGEKRGEGVGLGHPLD